MNNNCKPIDMECPECGSKRVNTFVNEIDFGQDKPVFAPVRRCGKCDFTWTDWVAEKIYDEVLKLTQDTKDIFKVIMNDKDLRKIIMKAFMWEGRPISVAAEISRARKLLWNRYKIDIEILC